MTVDAMPPAAVEHAQAAVLLRRALDDHRLPTLPDSVEELRVLVGRLCEVALLALDVGLSHPDIRAADPANRPRYLVDARKVELLDLMVVACHSSGWDDGSEP